MLKKTMILFAAIVLAMAFGISSAYAELTDEDANCPVCGDAFYYAEFDQYGPVYHCDYVDDNQCKDWYKVRCSNSDCQYEDIMAIYHSHDIQYPYSEGEYVDSSTHKITHYGSCVLCEHEFTKVTTGKHSYAWENWDTKRVYRCSGCGHIAKTDKLANTLSVTGKTVTAKAKALKKKAKTFSRTKVLTVSNAKGTVTYVKAKGNKKITINKSTGKVTVKKGLKKGTYKVVVKVTAAGNGTYKKATKSATFTVKVK